MSNSIRTKSFYRYPKNETRFLIRHKKKLISKNVNDFVKKFKLHDVVKLISKDFESISKKNKVINHFNLDWSGHKVGKYYLLVKIMKKGSFNGKVYKAPILSKKIVYFVKCLKIKNYLRYENLKKKDFKYSFKDIKNVKALKKAMIRRYKKSLLHINNIQIIRLGVSTTKLKIISAGPLMPYLR